MSGLVMPSNLPSFETMESVAELKNKGISDSQVAKQLKMQRKEVISIYETYKSLLVNDQEARDRAMDLLNVMVEQYDHLIAETHVVIDKLRNQMFDEKYAAQELKALTIIGDFIAKRLALVQQAGLLEASEIGDEYAEIEEKANILMGILRTDLCDDCRKKVKDKFAAATNQVEAIVVYDE